MGENCELVPKGHSEDSKLEKNEFADNDQLSEGCSGQKADSVKDTNCECARGVWLTQLTLHNGKENLGHGKSLLVITILYMSHFFSAWGDRMWAFAVTLFLLRLFPESLLLVGVYGLIMQLGVVVFGTIVGDWVDNNSRLRVAGVSLLVQNSLVAICSVVLAIAFHDHFKISYCKDVGQFFLVACVVIIMGTLANLATVANTISIERDWVVVIADKNKNTLATLNAWMRRIDLCCKLMAPVLVGAVITYTDYFTSTLFVAGWNVISYFAEFGLLCIVYYCIPTLAHKKSRKQSSVADSVEDQRDEEVEEEKVNQDKSLNEGDDENVFFAEPRMSKSCKQKFFSMLSKLGSPYITIRDGWKIYARQEIARVGIAMSLLYVTVLGFSGVTAAYFKIQGLTEVLIGVFQGVGGIIAIIGTFVYVPLRRRVGTIRAGLFGMSSQFIMLMFCVAAVFAPGNRKDTGGEHYYSPYCPSSSLMGSNTSNNVTVNMTIAPSQTITSISITSTYFMNATISLNPSPTQYNPSRLSNSTYSVPSYSYSINPHSNASGSVGANNTRNDNSENKHPYTISLILLLIGVLGARFGLWMFDLSVSQLLQEKVKEEERGVVSGVMNVFIANNDMLHYLLAIAAPDPKYFGILTLISVMFVGCGLLLYASYVHKVRGHLFHFADFYRRIKYDLESHRKLEHMTRLVNENDDDKEMKDDDSIEDDPDISGEGANL